MAQAYLNAIKDGVGIQIIAVLLKQSLSLTQNDVENNISDTLPVFVRNLGDLRKLEGVHIISEIRTAIFRTHQ